MNKESYYLGFEKACLENRLSKQAALSLYKISSRHASKLTKRATPLLPILKLFGAGLAAGIPAMAGIGYAVNKANKKRIAEERRTNSENNSSPANYGGSPTSSSPTGTGYTAPTSQSGSNTQGQSDSPMSPVHKMIFDRVHKPNSGSIDSLGFDSQDRQGFMFL